MARSVIEVIALLLWALGLTIVVEGGLAWLTLRSWEDLKLVVLVQCLTNPALNTLLLINDYFQITNRTALLIILEVIVAVVEALIYRKGLETKINPFVMSISLNLVSVAVGLVFTIR